MRKRAQDLAGGRPRLAPVRLRAVEEADLPAFYRHQREPEAVEMAHFVPREFDAFMDHWQKILRDETVVARTVLCGEQVAGNVMSFMRGDTREVGYWLGREYWGRGIATEALSQFLRQESTRPLYAGVARGNAGSIRVLEKCGFSPFREEGDGLLLRLG